MELEQRVFIHCLLITWKVYFCDIQFFSVMQLNTSPTTTTAPSPTLNKDHWQQRRYTFLSKNSMLGGELKDEVVHDHSTNVEQK